MNKILDLIFEDVKNENETKKTAVTLRISALIFIGYFLCLMAVFCSMGDWMKPGDTLIVTEISRLSRTLLEIMTILNSCIKKQVVLYSTKEGYVFFHCCSLRAGKIQGLV